MPLPSELAMTPDELDYFMKTCVHMRIATFSPGGRINVTPLVYGWADGKVYTPVSYTHLTLPTRDLV